MAQASAGWLEPAWGRTTPARAWGPGIPSSTEEGGSATLVTCVAVLRRTLTRRRRFADHQARTPSTMLRGHLVGTTRVILNPARANIAPNSFFVRSRPPMMSI